MVIVNGHHAPGKKIRVHLTAVLLGRKSCYLCSENS